MNLKKVIVIPDSFKGTLSSVQICDVVRERIAAHFPQCEVVCLPVADGGEGTMDSFLHAVGGERIAVTVQGAFGEPMQAHFAVLPDGTAVVEMAVCAGLPLVGERRDPMRTTTYGVGELMGEAIRRGCKRIIVGLGGSATNDCGCGAAAALGTVFRKADGTPFVPTGGTLSQIARIEKAELPADVEIIAMCDIDNPLYGKTGAAYVFAPQKGADAHAVETLDEGLRHTADVILKDLGCDVSALSGGGAAGGLGAGLYAFCGGRLQSGIETVLQTVRFDDRLEGADLVISGEGKLDSQSLGGKVVVGIAGHCKRKGVPLLAVVGGAERELPQVYETGITAVFPIGRLPEDFSVSRYKSEINLYETVDNVLRLLKI
ncbi:MAG: glycerate kinase [Clostridia bacterium]|nr:glycerate kinase [Clostridia bacterium]